MRASRVERPLAPHDDPEEGGDSAGALGCLAHLDITDPAVTGDDVKRSRIAAGSLSNLDDFGDRHWPARTHRGVLPGTASSGHAAKRGDKDRRTVAGDMYRKRDDRQECRDR